MDSLSQMLLGSGVAHVVLCSSAIGRGRAAVPETVGGQRVSVSSPMKPAAQRVALFLGAVLGTLPDLDVLVPYDDAVASFTYHRSWSHSLFVLSAVSLPLAMALSALFARYQWPLQASFKRWWLAVWLVLVTHPLLDGLTIYGTQLFWPLPIKPIGIGSIFIIDILYTLPLFAAVLLVWRRPLRKSRSRLIPLALALSTAYLAWTLVAQQLIANRLEQQMQTDELAARRVVVAPFPFSLLWRVVVITDNQHYEGFASLVDRKPEIPLFGFPNGRETCSAWLSHWPVRRLDWFTDGAIALQRRGNQLVISDLRMGIEDDYVFEFSVAEWDAGELRFFVSELQPLQFDMSRVASLFKRMVNQSVDIHAPLKEVSPMPDEDLTC